LKPAAFPDNQLNLPESGNGIPDVLDEALWAISFYLEHQYPDGAIPLGRANLSDARKQNFKGEKQAPMPPFGIIPPMRESTPMFAAAAAQISRLIRPYDAAQADRLLDGAQRAFDVAERRGISGLHEDHYSREAPILVLKNKDGKEKYPPVFAHTMVWAAVELLRATGESRYNEYVVANRKAANNWDDYECPRWSYLQVDPAKTDPKTREDFRSELLSNAFFGAEVLVARTAEGAYRMSNGNGKQVGWGRAQGITACQRLIYAYELTKKRYYLDAVALNADWHCGANPISQTFLTRMGYRHPNRPEISWFLYLDRTESERIGDTIMGIPIYGFGPPIRTYPGDPNDKGKPGWPLWRSWRDIWGNYAEIYSEFTISQTVGPASATYAYLYAQDLEQGAVSKDAKPQFPLGARTR